MNPLEQFHRNKVQKEAVKLFMIDCLKDMAVERAFDGKGVVGIAEANIAITKSFDKLTELYDIKEKVIINNPR